MKTRERSVEEMCEGAHAHSDLEHLVICPACGQVFDCRNEAHLAHHARAHHAPWIGRQSVEDL